MKRILLVSVIALSAVFVWQAQSVEAEHMAIGRIYVSPIAGDGSADNPFTAEVCTREFVTRCRNAIGGQASGPNRGHPLHEWSLTYVETRDFSTGEPDWSDFGDTEPWLVRLDEDLDATVPQTVKTRVRQAGALTQAELGDVTTYYSLLDKMLKKQFGELATVENQFREFFEGH